MRPQPRRRKDLRAYVQAEGHDHGRDELRHDVADEDQADRAVKRARGLDELPPADGEHDAAHEARVDADAHEIDKVRERGETRAVKASGSTLQVGFIGAGFSARLHAEAYHQVRGMDVALTRVAPAQPERAARFAEASGIGAVAASAEEVLAATDVDVVDLCVPTSLHAPLAIKAARAGKHVIVEKPLTGCFAPPATPRAEMLRRALASGDEILAACRKSGVRLCYAENWVYAPPVQRARRLLTAAGGPILRIVGEESHGGRRRLG